MSVRQLDLPLEHTPAGRFLPWIVAGLIYLAVLALAVAAVADGAVRLLELRPRVLTVALPPPPSSPEAAFEDPSRGGSEVEAALALLRRTAGVIGAEPVPAAELRQLVEPWLVGDAGGAQAAGGDELLPPLPRLIDVTFARGAEIDLAALEERLRAAVPGASLDPEAMTLGRAEDLARYVRVLALASAFAVVAGVLVVVGLVTRMSLGLHRDTVELLRMMGAPDAYLARQFERHALLTGLRGGLLGFVAAILTVLLLVYGSRLLQLLSSLPLDLRPVDWVVLACVPVVGALLITAVARLTAVWSLSRMA